KLVAKKLKTLALELKFPRFKYQHLPRSLTSLSISVSEGQSSVPTLSLDLDTLFPNLVYLNLNQPYFQEVTGRGNLKYFCQKFTKINSIPNSLTQLKVLNLLPNDDKNINVIFPPNLTYLDYVPIRDLIKGLKVYPFSLKTLLIENDPISNTLLQDSCPPNLANYKNNHFKLTLDTPFIPPSATKASISINTEMIQLPQIPTTVTSLEMTTYYQGPFIKPIENGYFSNGITNLSLQYDLALTPGLIPSSVTNLKLNYSQPIVKDAIPTSVTKLALLGVALVQPVILPDSITCLSLLQQHNIPFITLPKNLCTLKISKNMNFQTFPYHLFPTIKTLSCNQVYNLTNFAQTFSISSGSNEYDLHSFPSNIKQVKFTYFNSTKCNFYFINQKVYKEINHERSNRFITF
ncbi:hypothetical protein CYY_009580, partial [Polysphondylium violaceum]